ncbi:MAG TPA: hypothetical protein PKC29_06195 [Thermodesulfobacteriota bacterium]|nr:hypothetical protein [Thermodesulfobacteriota bacterium]
MEIQRTTQKGQAAEEAVRNYFISQGYFVVRGIPFIYKGFDVTDIDLWLYKKSSSITRERSCVDIKRRATPKAMERMLWTIGLKEVLDLNYAIVVTSDNRDETREFGIANGVTVLQGNFLKRAIDDFLKSNIRITEDELFSGLNVPPVINSRITWARFFKSRKSILVSQLSFNSCNRLLKDISILLEEYLVSNKKPEASIRLLYIHIAYFLINTDYRLSFIAHYDTTTLKKILNEGFRYGESGLQRTQEIVDIATKLLVNSGHGDLFSKEMFKEEVNKQFSNHSVEILAEYFAKPEIVNKLFDQAIHFEHYAYRRDIILPSNLPTELKATLGLFCDYLKIDRREII